MMKEHLKHTLLFMLFAVIFTAVFTGAAASAETPRDGDYLQYLSYGLNGAGSGYVITGCDKSVTEMVIPDIINGLPVTEIGRSAFQACSSLASVVIPASVRSIGGFAFHQCESLSSVALSYGIESIDGYAFAKCYSLTGIDMPNSVTSIGSFIFAECEGITSVFVPESAASIDDNAFSRCVSLESITVHEENPDYSGMGGALYDKPATRLIKCPEGFTGVYGIPDGVTSVRGGAFANCAGLTYVFVPESVTGIGEGAFTGCASLESITVAQGNANYGSLSGLLCDKNGTTILVCPGGLEGRLTIPPGITTIGARAFEYCARLANVTMPEGVTSIGASAFTHCTGLTIVKTPNSMERIHSNAFDYCESLRTAIIPSYDTSLDNTVFRYCDSGLVIYGVPGGSGAESHADRSGIPFYPLSDYVEVAGVSLDNTSATIQYGGDALRLSATVSPADASVKDVIWRSGDESVAVVSEAGIVTGVSEGTVSITAVTVDGGFTAMCEVTVMNYLQYLTYTLSSDGDGYVITGCDTSVTEMVIPDAIHGLPVTDIERSAFFSCSSLASVVIPASVRNIGSFAFHKCESLTSVTLSYGIEYIGDFAFAYCTSLTSVEIPNSVVTIRNHIFAYCTGITSVVVPESAASISDDAFTRCANLKTITVDAGNPNYQSIGGALYDKPATIIIKCPEGYTGAYSIPDGVTIIRYEAFLDCRSLTGVTIPFSVTVIDEGAFKNCGGLAGVTIPSSVTDIGKEAFGNCDSLTGVIIPSGVTVIGEGAFSGCAVMKSITVDEGNERYRSMGGVLYDKDVTRVIAYPGGLEGEMRIPDSVTSVESNAFFECAGLTGVMIPYGVRTIGVYAFTGCTGLTSVTIPGSMSMILPLAFYGCVNLETALIHGSPQLLEEIFDGCDKLTIYGAAGSGVERYANNNNIPFVEYAAPAEGVTLDKTSASIIPGGDALRLIATVSPADATIKDVIWRSGDESVAAVSQEGLVTGVTEGAAVITVATVDGGFSASCEVMVGFSASLPDEITVLAPGGEKRLEVTVLPAGYEAQYAWSSGDENVATVSGDGLVSAVNEGVAEITVSVTGALRTMELTRTVCVVASINTMTLPSYLTEIEREALAGISANEVILAQNVKTIGARAFADNASLLYIDIPDGIEDISPNAFEGCPYVTLIGSENGYCQNYAETYGLYFKAR